MKSSKVIPCAMATMLMTGSKFVKNVKLLAFRFEQAGDLDCEWGSHFVEDFFGYTVNDKEGDVIWRCGGGLRGGRGG